MSTCTVKLLLCSLFREVVRVLEGSSSPPDLCRGDAGVPSAPSPILPLTPHGILAHHYLRNGEHTHTSVT